MPTAHATALIALGHPHAEARAFELLEELYLRSDGGEPERACLLALDVYITASEHGLALVASEAACVAAYAYDAVGDRRACGVWAERALLHPDVDRYDWAPLAHALAAIGLGAAGDHRRSRDQLRYAIALQRAELISPPGPSPTAGILGCSWIPSTTRRSLPI